MVVLTASTVYLVNNTIIGTPLQPDRNGPERIGPERIGTERKLRLDRCGAPRERNSEGPSLRGSFLLLLDTNNGTPNLRGPDMHGNRPGVHCAVFSREDALVRL